MTREIKFRGWDKDEKEMFDDVCTDTDDFTNMLNETFKYWGNHDFEPRLIIMQFTGLKDKNGVEIYEGDIIVSTAPLDPVISKPWVFEIKWDKWQESNEYGDRLICGFSMDNITSFDDLKEMEIIGNIYQNPELLNK